MNENGSDSARHTDRPIQTSGLSATDIFPQRHALVPVGESDKGSGLVVVSELQRQIISRAGSRELPENAFEAFDNDQAAVTASSFKKAVDSGKELGKDNEAALELQTRDWLASEKSRSPFAQLRGTAVLAEALGEFRLEEGNRLDPRSHQCNKARTLKGYDYDFGDEATTFLRMAAGSLLKAEDFVSKHKGETVDGKKLDDRYMQQLKAEEANTESKLNLIYGKHDIAAVYAGLLKQSERNTSDLQEATVGMGFRYDAMSKGDPLHVAKAARDLSLAYFAFAEHLFKAGNAEDAQILSKAAQKYLSDSMKLDSNAPDNEAIQKIASKIASQLPRK